MASSIIKAPVLFIFFCFPFLLAQVHAQRGNVVAYNLIHPLQVRPGDSLQVIVSFTVAPGWHVYAPTNANRRQRLSLTTSRIIRMPANFTQGRAPDLPPMSVERGNEVFKGTDNQFVFALHTDKQSPAGRYELEIEFSYQACNQLQCLSAVSERKVIEIAIADQ